MEGAVSLQGNIVGPNTCVATEELGEEIRMNSFVKLALLISFQDFVCYVMGQSRHYILSLSSFDAFD